MPNHFRPLPVKDQMDPSRPLSILATGPRSKQSIPVQKPREQLLTYMYGEKKVYVAAALTYQVRFLPISHIVQYSQTLQEAIDRVMEVFPELEKYPREQVTLVVSAKMHDQRTPVEISESAWAHLVPSLHQFEVMYITLLDKPRPSPQLAKCAELEPTDLPPQYSAPVGQQFLSADGRKGGLLHRPPSRSPSPSIGERVKSWFKNESEH